MYLDISELKGKTLSSIEGAETGNDLIIFNTTDGKRHKMFHSQDCCESVTIEEIVGDIADLIDTPILVAEEVSSDDAGQLPDSDESWTWTFYKIETIKGSVNIRWYGTSNGYYSEGVDFEEIK